MIHSERKLHFVKRLFPLPTINKVTNSPKYQVTPIQIAEALIHHKQASQTAANHNIYRLH